MRFLAIFESTQKKLFYSLFQTRPKYYESSKTQYSDSTSFINRLTPLIYFFRGPLTEKTLHGPFMVQTDNFFYIGLYKRVCRVTYEVAKFHKCLIYFHVKFESDCLKIDGGMAILLGNRILEGFFNRPIATH